MKCCKNDILVFKQTNYIFTPSYFECFNKHCPRNMRRMPRKKCVNHLKIYAATFVSRQKSNDLCPSIGSGVRNSDVLEANIVQSFKSSD